ncbi:DUF3488 domain-containing protein [Noviherbaspirillum cavernae]|uniref:DUF3488 domain-containing protein n=2 Tax=Noviherbaspirillum cavernae TaxID=2320862 RepID=A0A418X5W6_9BURK|nr:DUF3488 domain-containing protein [Noviherbaspirillum cavernae]
MRPFMRRITQPLSRDKSDTLLLLATCVLVLAPHAGHLPAWIVAACSAILLWRGWVTFRGHRMPSRNLLVPIAVLTMAAVYWHYKTIFGREAGVAMLVLLLTFKLLEMHARRDLFVVLFLGFFLVLASFFYSQSIGAALMTIAATVAILTTQLSFQYTGVVPPFAQRLRLGAFILLLAAPLTLVLFLLFPRIQGPLWGMPVDAQSARTGLSDNMSPGAISRLAQSDDIAFRAKFVDPPPPKSRLYWRGPVLGSYNGRTWTPLQVRLKTNRPIVIKSHGTPLRYQVTLEPSNQRWLFALELPQTPPVLRDNASAFGPNLELLASSPINERVRYDAASVLDFELQPQESATALRLWLDLPQGFNPRTRELAATLRKRSSDNAEMVNAVLRFFREEKFRYTLEPPVLGTHAVDEFLFDTRAGFCEHYSSAFVVLMRAMGIPARVVTGYQGGEINPADGYMTIRQSDAHAWAEVWLANRGWVRVDPTAAVSPARIEMNLTSVIPRRTLGGLITLDAGQNSWLAKWQALRQNWDAVTNAWNQWVLNYTPDKQRSLIQSLGFDSADWRTLTGLLAVAASIVLAIVVLPLMWNRPQFDPVEAVYRTLCRRMARLGCARLAHEGPRAWRDRLSASDSPLAPERRAAVARFLDSYERARYGTMSKDASAVVSNLKSLLAECR